MGAERENVDHEGGEAQPGTVPVSRWVPVQILSSQPLSLLCKDQSVASPVLRVHVLACLHGN